MNTIENFVADDPLTQADIDTVPAWRCAWCGKPVEHKPSPGTHGVVCAKCATNGQPGEDHC